VQILQHYPHVSKRPPHGFLEGRYNRLNELA
jgi:hypothetical protein